MGATISSPSERNLLFAGGVIHGAGNGERGGLVKVNGEFRQNGNTGDMMFPVKMALSYISRFMTLLPGDVVATGTPSGVAMGMNPPEYLHQGDYVEPGIEGLGEMSQRVAAG